MIQVAFDAHVIGERRTGNETYARGLIHAFENEPADDLRFVYYGGKAIKKLGLRSRTTVRTVLAGHLLPLSGYR